MEYLLPWQVVRVDGHSMTPTLCPGDLVLVRHGAPIETGQVVLARFRSYPDLLVVKRADRADGSGWLLLSDNAAAGSDSRQYGVADVLGRVVLRQRGPLGRQLDGVGRGWWAPLLGRLPRRVVHGSSGNL